MPVLGLAVDSEGMRVGAREAVDATTRIVRGAKDATDALDLLGEVGSEAFDKAASEVVGGARSLETFAKAAGTAEDSLSVLADVYSGAFDQNQAFGEGVFTTAERMQALNEQADRNKGALDVLRESYAQNTSAIDEMQEAQTAMIREQQEAAVAAQVHAVEEQALADQLAQTAAQADIAARAEINLGQASVQGGNGIRGFVGAMREAITTGRGLQGVLTVAARNAGIFGAVFFGGDLISRLATGRSLIGNVNAALEAIGTTVRGAITDFLGLGDALEKKFGKGAREATLTVTKLRDEIEKLRQEKELSDKVFIGGLTTSVGQFGHEFPLDTSGIDRSNVEDAKQLLDIITTLQERITNINSGIVSFGPQSRIRAEEAAIDDAIAAVDALRDASRKHAKAAEESARKQEEWNKALEAGAAMKARADDAERLASAFTKLATVLAVTSARGAVDAINRQAAAENERADAIARAARISEEFERRRNKTLGELGAQNDLDAFIQGLEDQVRLTQMSADAAEQESAVLQARNILLAQNLSLTEDQEKAIRGLVAEKQRLSAVDERTGTEDFVKSLQRQIEIQERIAEGGVRAGERLEMTFRALDTMAKDGITDTEKWIVLIDALLDRLEKQAEANKRVAEIEADRRRLGQDVGAAIAAGGERALTAWRGLSDVIKSVYQDIVAIAYRATVTKFLSTTFGNLFAGGPEAQAKGNIFQYGRVVPFASGGYVGGPTLFPMAGGDVGLMGEQGAEAIVPLERNPRTGKLNSVNVSGAGRTVVINQKIYANDYASFRKSRTQQYDDARFLLQAG